MWMLRRLRLLHLHLRLLLCTRRTRAHCQSGFAATDQLSGPESRFHSRISSLQFVQFVQLQRRVLSSKPQRQLHKRMTSYVSRETAARQAQRRRGTALTRAPTVALANLTPSQLAQRRLNLRPSMLQYYVLPAFGLDRLHYSMETSVSAHS